LRKPPVYCTFTPPYVLREKELRLSQMPRCR
jgi:hypothetical protein